MSIMEREYQRLLAEGRRVRAWRKKWELVPQTSAAKRKNKSKSKEGKV